MKSVSKHKITICLVVVLFTTLTIVFRIAHKNSPAEKADRQYSSSNSVEHEFIKKKASQNKKDLESLALRDVRSQEIGTNNKAITPALDLIDDFSVEVPLPQDLDFVEFIPLPGMFQWESSSISPNETSLDPNILQFVNNHNAMLCRIRKLVINSKIKVKGDDYMPCNLELDRDSKTLIGNGRSARAAIKGSTFFAYLDENGSYDNSHLLLLYGLVFRPWLAEDLEFVSVRSGKIVKRDAEGKRKLIEVNVLRLLDKKKLFFEKQTGRLVCMTLPLLHYGRIRFDMDNFTVVDKTRDIVLPTDIKVRIPKELIVTGPQPDDFDGVIQLKFDPTTDLKLE